MLRHVMLLLAISAAWIQPSVLRTSRCYEAYPFPQNEQGCHWHWEWKYAWDKLPWHLECFYIQDANVIKQFLLTTVSSIRVLTISSSTDLTLKPADFQHAIFDNLTTVHIRSCGQSSIGPGVFAGPRQLSELSYSDNNVSEINAASFIGLQNLTSIKLEKDNIETIAGDSFKNMTQLRSITLQQNKITSLPDHTFAGLRYVDSLTLKGNKLTCLNDQTLTGLVGLRKLDLSGNKIARISVGAFRDLVSLVSLNLRSNRLQRLDPGLFHTNKVLSKLALSLNNLENLSNFQLNIPSLSSLHVKRCKIETLPGDFFGNLPNLTDINLEGNLISVIARGTFAALPDFSNLDLSGNAFTTINVVQLQEWFFPSPFQQHLHIVLSDNSWNCSTSDLISVRSFCAGNHCHDYSNNFTCGL